jgi:CBS domain-containing protein
MPNAFNFQASPFDCLSPAQQQLVRDHVDIAYFQADQVVLNLDAAPTHLFVIIKGFVQQFDGSEVVATYGPEDCFDGRALMAGKVSSRFVASEEVVAYALEKQAVSELIAANATFGALLFADLSHKLSALSERHSQHELQSLTMARVDEAFVRPAHCVDASTDIVSVVRLFQAERTVNVLVRDSRSVPPRMGIFTATALQRAILHGTPLDRLPVGELANFNLVTVRPSDPVGEALAVMLRHKVHRVVVAEGEHIHGILETLDLFSFLSNHSYLITVQILDAQDLDALQAPAAQITRLIGLLHRGGTRIDMIAAQVRELNSRLFERAWALVAPPALVANSCLFVMGSEGRGEQLLKTDQDNALVLRDGFECDDLQAICARFSEALQSFGYPPCPGHIMLSNPQWCQPASAFARQVREWLLMPTPESLMNLAIFLDAHAICGDTRLLDELRGNVAGMLVDNQVVLARFAAPLNQFAESSGWRGWLGLSEGPDHAAMDIKKAGLFPLVHGVRSLALEHGVAATGTAARIEALVAQGALTAAQGTDLTQSLHFFMGLRLKAGLADLAAHRAVTGEVTVARLNSLDRDLLKDTLAVVKRFRTQLQQRYRLDAL